MADKYLQWVENASIEKPQLAEQLSQLGEFYHKKLWHQLTLQLEAAIDDPAFQADGFLIDLYQNFIAGFAHKLNLLKLAFFAVATSKQMPNPQDGMTFLQDVIGNLEASKQTDTKEPILYLKMQIAQYLLIIGNVSDCKRLMLEGEQELSSMHDVDPQLSAAVHYVAMQYYKSQNAYASFYRSALLYLAFISQDSLSEEFRRALAVDISLAALLGDDVYNFGELLLHPIMNVLTEPNSTFSWIHQLLECFHHGDIHRYDQLCIQHASLLNSQPALVSDERKLREKITVLSLMELVNSLPADSRRIPLSAIAERTKLPIDGVEFLLMKALSLHLIEGSIDQVDGSVSVSWVVSRVLTMPQVELLSQRLDVWVDKVGDAALTLERDAIGIIDG